jgi:hypothetical protein
MTWCGVGAYADRLVPVLLEMIGFALDGEDLGVVDQAVDQRDDAGGIWKPVAQ